MNIDEKIRAVIEHPPNFELGCEFAKVLERFDSKSWHKRTLGNFTPAAWFLEPVRGCNLRCGFCYCATLPRGEFEYMSFETLEELLSTIAAVSPCARVEFAQAGEPTLHPHFLEFVRRARQALPEAQLLTYTNGVMLVEGKMNFGEMLDAGLNAIFVDMYHPIERFLELAEGAGAEVYNFLNKDSMRVSPFTNQHRPEELRAIYLAPNPGHWREGKKRSVQFSTFLNHLDWERAAPYGIMPVEVAPNRRCDQPSKYVPIDCHGDYIFCCTDFHSESAGELGNVSEGLEGFLDFWLGEYMQRTRVMLYQKDRNAHEHCRKCRSTFNRCDIPRHDPALLRHFVKGGRWYPLQK